MARILLVDDDASLLEGLTLAFEEAGHTTLAAHDGTTALALIRQERPETVVCDVNLPGVDGFSICRRLREQNNPVPLILLTSRDSEIDETLGLDLGADDYLAKPFSMRVLLALVRRPDRARAVRSHLADGRAARPGALPLNALLSTLEERRGANEAFVADLVHELKNPVATIRVCADALAAAPAERERAARLSRLLTESSHRLDTLISQFLELARRGWNAPRRAFARRPGRARPGAHPRHGGR